jgi:hypothetical protein
MVKDGQLKHPKKGEGLTKSRVLLAYNPTSAKDKMKATKKQEKKKDAKAKGKKKTDKKKDGKKKKEVGVSKSVKKNMSTKEKKAYKEVEDKKAKLQAEMRKLDRQGGNITKEARKPPVKKAPYVASSMNKVHHVFEAVSHVLEGRKGATFQGIFKYMSNKWSDK